MKVTGTFFNSKFDAVKFKNVTSICCLLNV
jgi:hypothetical protein